MPGQLIYHQDLNKRGMHFKIWDDNNSGDVHDIGE
jgi:hypothetical protein